MEVSSKLKKDINLESHNSAQQTREYVQEQAKTQDNTQPDWAVTATSTTSLTRRYFVATTSITKHYG